MPALFANSSSSSSSSHQPSRVQSVSQSVSLSVCLALILAAIFLSRPLVVTHVWGFLGGGFSATCWSRSLSFFLSLCRNAILLCSRCLSFSTERGWVEGRKSSGLFLDPSEFLSFVTLLLYSSNPLHCLCVFVCFCTSAPYNCRICKC